jgi:hypothetical protein
MLQSDPAHPCSHTHLRTPLSSPHTEWGVCMQSVSSLHAHVATTEHVSLVLGLPRAPSPNKHMESFTTAKGTLPMFCAAVGVVLLEPPIADSGWAPDRHSTLLLRVPTPLRQLLWPPSCGPWDDRAHWLQDPADHVTTCAGHTNRLQGRDQGGRVCHTS